MVRMRALLIAVPHRIGQLAGTREFGKYRTWRNVTVLPLSQEEDTPHPSENITLHGDCIPELHRGVSR